MAKIIKAFSLPAVELIKDLIDDRKGSASAHPELVEGCTRVCDLQMQALETYRQLCPVIRDQELNKLISCDINWEELIITGRKHKQEVYSRLLPLNQALLLYPELSPIIQNFLNSESSGLKISLLALAATAHAQVLYISPGTKVPELVSRVVANADTLEIDFLCIVICAGAEIIYRELIENLAHAVVIKSLFIYLEPQAKLNLIVDNRGDGILLSHICAHISVGAELIITAAHTHTQTTLSFVDFELQGEKAVIAFADNASLKQTAQYALCVNQLHNAPHAESSVCAKVLLQDTSRAFYRGNISIEKSAPQSTAKQKQVALMLSAQARTCSIPSLEVHNNLVNCTHGTATGKLSEDQLWYLYSRGLSEEQASRLIVDGFFGNFDSLPYTQELRTRLQEHTHDR